MRGRRHRALLGTVVLIVVLLFYIGLPSPWPHEHFEPSSHSRDPQTPLLVTDKGSSLNPPQTPPESVQAKPQYQNDRLEGQHEPQVFPHISLPGPVKSSTTGTGTAFVVAAPTHPAAAPAQSTLPAARTDPIQNQSPVYQDGQARIGDDATIIKPLPKEHWLKSDEHFPIAPESLIQLPTGTPKLIPRIQHRFGLESSAAKSDRESKQALIRASFQRSWVGYKEHAWLHDELRPLSGGYKDPFCGWAATLVDSLDTLWIMGFTDDFEEAANAAARIDFTTTPRADIPVFETTIRYLGGLLGAYDISGAKYSILLEKAVELAEILMGAFDTPNRMPVLYYHWSPTYSSQPHRAGHAVVLAELGSLSLEFTRLAQLTGKDKYYDAIARITNALEALQGNTSVPGLFPINIDASGCAKTPVNRSPGISRPQGRFRPVGYENLSQTSAGLALGSSIQNAGLVVDVRDQDSFDKDGSVFGHVTDDLKTSQINDHSAKSTKPAAESYRDKDKSSYDEMVPVKTSKPRKQKRQSKSSAPPPLPRVSVGGASSLSSPFDTVNRSGGKRDSLPDAAVEIQQVGVPSTVTIAELARASLYATQQCMPTGLAIANSGMLQKYSLDSSADSTYEYLPKEWLLLGGLSTQYQRMHEYALDSALRNLLYRPMIKDESREIRFMGTVHTSGKRNSKGELDGGLSPTVGHLSCFVGGYVALSAKLFGREEDLEIASRLTDGCVWGYESTTTGLMPEIFSPVTCENMTSCPWNEGRWAFALDPFFEARLHPPTLTAAPTPIAHLPALPVTGPSDTTSAVMSTTTTNSINNLVRRQQIDVQPLTSQAVSDSTPTTRPYADSTADSTNMGSGDPATIEPPVALPSPLSHEDFVKEKMKDQRLPYGIEKINDRRYILR